jgi:hypothetical protein
MYAAGLLLATGDRRLRVDFEKSYQPLERLQNDQSYLRQQCLRGTPLSARCGRRRGVAGHPSGRQF